MEEQEKVEEKTNGTASWVHGIGVAIIIAGVIGAIIINGMTANYGVTSDEETYYQTMALAVAISGIISGTLFIGIGEVIRLLFEINENAQQ